MKTKDQLQLEQAYQNMIAPVNEDAQDAAEDNALKANLKRYLISAVNDGYMEAGRFAQDRVSDVVIGRLMEFIQDHCRKAEAKAYDEGIEFAREMQSNYPE